MDTTIAAVNLGLRILKDDMIMVQYSKVTYFDQLEKDLKVRKTKYNQLAIQFNTL